MNDLIKRSDAIKAIDECYALLVRLRVTARRALEAVPSADRPQGEWIKRFGLINCSVCKHSNWSDSFEDLLKSFNYCPNCGARMKGVDDE